MLYFLLLLVVLSNAGETICYKNSKVQKHDEVLFGVTFWSFLLSLLAFIIFLFTGGDFFISLDYVTILYIFLMSILNVFCIISWSITSKNLPMSVAEGVSEIYIAILTFLSWLCFGGEIDIWDISLVLVLVLSCILLAFVQKREKIKGNYKIGLIFLTIWVVFAVFKGLLPGFIAGSEMFSYIFLLNLFIFLEVNLYFLIRRKKFNNFLPAIRDPYLFGVGLSRVVSQIVVIILALTVNLGIIDAVGVLGLVLIMLYERFIMKNKISLKTIILLIVITLSSGALAILA